MRYAAAFHDGDYCAWLSTQETGPSQHPLTCTNTNILWFDTREDCEKRGIPVVVKAFEVRGYCKVMTEEEVMSYLVMRRLYESTFVKF